jgi:hypothetical protein
MVLRMTTILRSSGETPAWRERDQRRTPDVDRAVLSQIAHRPDREIDRAVDLAEAGTSLAGSRIVHDGEQSQSGR